MSLFSSTIPTRATSQDEIRIRIDFLKSAYLQFKTSTFIAPSEVQETMELLEAGELDRVIGQFAPEEEVSSSPRLFHEVKEFSYAEWKKRHQIEE